MSEIQRDPTQSFRAARKNKHQNAQIKPCQKEQNYSLLEKTQIPILKTRLQLQNRANHLPQAALLGLFPPLLKDRLVIIKGLAIPQEEAMSRQDQEGQQEALESNSGKTEKINLIIQSTYG